MSKKKKETKSKKKAKGKDPRQEFQKAILALFDKTPGKVYDLKYILKKLGLKKREDIKLPESDMFRAELEMFAESCVSGKSNELTAHNGNVAVAVVYAALRSIDRKGQSVRIADILDETRAKIGSQARAA